MSESIPQRIEVKPPFAAHTRINAQQHQQLLTQATQHPDEYWAAMASQFDWFKPWDRVSDVSFASPVHIRWFDGAELNITHNCLDRHLPEKAHKTAIIWQGDAPEDVQHITYAQLHADVCRAANMLRGLGVKKGDTVTIYLPMIPQAVVAMLACARIGAVHSVVFAGFSAEALRGRVIDCASRVVITADEGMRGGKRVALKTQVDEAVRGLEQVTHVLMVRRTGAEVEWHARDLLWDDLMTRASTDCPPAIMQANDPLFILYTSGSTGKPKGILHHCGGYMVWAGWTHRNVFDLQENDVYWCTADVGWITGHSYIVYGPLLNGTTSVMFEGVPNYPDESRFWRTVDAHHVTIFYTAPTAIRALMAKGDEFVRAAQRSSLRLLGSVGEPINPAAWWWYYQTVGQARCPVIDTWWQTETGGILIAPLAGAHALKPGSATLPLPGVQAVLLDHSGTVMNGEGEGVLAMRASWPGQAASIWGDHARFEQTYFSTYPGYYFTGDGARRDADGFYWITGRVDDVLNVSGHRLGTAEIESALVAHEAVAEAAVVGFPHEIKGQGIYAFVTLSEAHSPSAELEKALRQFVRQQISPIATPDVIHLTPGLPKTRSGKIMRRILRKIAEGEFAALGDISTLTNPEIVAQLIEGRKPYP